MGTNRRYKPICKKILKYRENTPLFYNKVKKFKKHKWLLFISRLNQVEKKRMILDRGSRDQVLDQHLLYAPKFLERRKQNFKSQLIAKQKLKLFYGLFSTSYLNSVVNESRRKVSLNLSLLPVTFYFIQKLESRLDVVLLRSHFVSNLFNARQLISQGHILVNGKTQKISSAVLKKGDIIELSAKVKELIVFNILNSRLWPLPSQYLQINYKTLTIFFLAEPNVRELSLQFSFFFNLNRIIR